MVRLEPMTRGDLEGFLDTLDRGYAEEHARAGTWSREQALERARAETAELLPNGVDTPDQYLRVVLDEVSGERVGEVWYALRDEGGIKQLWIFWIGIDPAHRRKGYAAQVLSGLEAEARRLGVAHLALHVFGQNTGAIALYQKSGYVATNLVMRKTLAPG